MDPFSGLATLSPMELGQGPGGLAFTLLMVTGFWGRGLGGPGGPASLEEGKTSLPGHPARLEVGQEDRPLCPSASYEVVGGVREPPLLCPEFCGPSRVVPD